MYGNTCTHIMKLQIHQVIILEFLKIGLLFKLFFEVVALNERINEAYKKQGGYYPQALEADD